MIQLKVYDDSRQLTQYWLDLYETEPIKLNLSVEDITNAEAKSVFSRTFRVPATPANNIFFKHAFLVEGIDYDVTIKKPAEIIVDGAEFRQGHIRLQRIYVNGAQDKIDYEIIFLGETRDFSSAIGDATMCSLNITELSHTVSFDELASSWGAYPSETKWDPATNSFVSQTPTLTDGLKNGDVLYPLIDFGNTYNDSGDVQEARISTGGAHNFTQGPESNILKSLDLNRFKPMIRAKKLVDKIFSDAGYTFTSVFFDSDKFKQVYVSAFGNESRIDLSLDANSDNIMLATDSTTQGISDSGLNDIIVNDNVADPSTGNTFTTDGKNYQYTTSSSYYVAPVTGSYIFQAEANYMAWFDNYCSWPGQAVAGRLLLTNAIGSTIYATGSYGANGLINIQGIVSLTAGDQVHVKLETESSVCQAQITSSQFQTVSAPGASLPTASLDCDYKQIEFIKDLLTTFRLVMSPDPADGRNFIIEPFVDYVASGDLYDWSDKLIRDKDFIIEPLFNTQSDQIDFKHKEDSDYINTYHQQAYKDVFGYLEFDSGNELLKGIRNIETNWAPTPLSQIEGAGNTSRFIIPQLNTRSITTGNIIEHLPIKPKTRFLFYNGLQEILTQASHWYMVGMPGTVNGLDYYPMVSYYNEWPMTVDSEVLNWNVDVPYWGTNVSGYNGLITQNSLYTEYWSNYINSLYDKNARRITAYFTLNNVDLQTFSFDDVIFVDGVYYRPEKINDAQIGVTGPVKVQLIKLLDYVATPVSDAALNFTATPAGPSCFNGNDGQITYLFTAPLPAFPVSWSSSSGDTGTFNINPGLISNQTPGTYAITITDATGRTSTDTIVVPQSSAALLTTTANVTNPSDCYTSDGAVTITASGGTGPYTILWSDGSTQFTRTGLASATYSFTVTDNNGCTTALTSVLVSCQVVIPPGDISYIREYNVGGLCQGETQGSDTDIVVIRVNSGNTPAEPTDGFYTYDGDWASLQSQYGTAQGTIVQMLQNTQCSNNTDWYYDATSFFDSAEYPLLCLCDGSFQNPFLTQIQTIGTNPYIFVATP